MEDTLSSTADSVIEMYDETVVKQEAGQMDKVEILAKELLNKRFPKWKDGNKTYMIPPIFQPKQSRPQIGVSQSVPLTDPGDDGESIIYNLLKKLGEDERMGMFVVHGFVLKDIKTWNKNCKSEYLVPELASKTGESDFIIFNHLLGIILLEVKNELSVSESTLNVAQDQLTRSHSLIIKFGDPDVLSNDATQTENDDRKLSDSKCSIPYRKVISLPSTKKADFNLQSPGEDTLLLFEDHSQSISSFRKWWHEAIEKPAMVKMSVETQEAYERALSYILMIRHLGPVTETECIAKIHESLDKYKYHEKVAYHQVMAHKFPYFYGWCWNVLNKKDKEDAVLSKKTEEELQQSFMKRNKLNEEQLRGKTGIKRLDKLLRQSKYLDGDEYSLIDNAISAVFEDYYLLFFKNTLEYIIKMREMWQKIEEKDTRDAKEEEVLEKYPFVKLESPKDFNMLDRHLERSTFIKGDTPSEIDKQVFETLTCQMRLKHALHPIVMTSEQLVVFEGPSKQLIIGPPGSGKTELLKFKAHELNTEMKICKTGKKIMYILANGSPDYRDRNSLLFYRMKEFFKKSSLVEVISIVLEEESAEDTEHTTSEIRRKIKSGEYEHAFIDEYWIGSKPYEHKIIEELVRGLPGYVWISSVFNYQRDLIKEDERMKNRTQPLLTALDENGGVVNHITQVLRPGNSIIDLEREYSKLYENRSYPYGTAQILGHSYEGLPVTWAVAKNENYVTENVNEMYDKCVEIVNIAINDVPQLDAIKREKLTLDPADILIVDFAIRTDESRQLKQSLLARLTNNHIPVWTFDESLEQFMECKIGKVTLLQPVKRSASEFLDGVEWPMVVVILPSGMLLKTAKLADDAEKLRSHDSYISFFRTMVKLVVISDKWTKKEEFLSDVKTQI